jgi:hypothetical protein
MAQEQLCMQCGTVAYMKRFMKGSLLTEIFLWLCALLPGLIYSIWRHTTVYWGCPQCDSPNVIPLTSPVAQKFFSETKPGQPLSAYRVPVTVNKGSGMSAGKIVAIGFGVILLASIVRVATVANQTQTQTPEARVTDADQLVKNCGQPFKDDSTANDSPRPPIVTRFVEYKVKGAHLRFVFVPGNGHAGDSPPYDWKLQMIANARTNRLYNHDQLSSLMWCAAPLPAPRFISKVGN